MAVDPYAAPKSHVADVPATRIDGNFVAEGRGVPSGNGWNWIAQGWDIVKGQKGTWIGIIIILAVVLIVLNFIPFIGPLILMFVLPVLYGGIMIGCEEVHQGGKVEVGHLFAGFSRNTGRLMGVGGASLLAFIGIMVLVMIMFGGDMARMMMGAKPDPAQMQAMGLRFMLVPLIVMALSIPLYMALWFATPLIALNDFAVGEALKASFSACLKNIVPFLLYGIIFFILAIVASIPLGLGWLLLGPVLLASIYTSYRDVFHEA